MFNNKNNYNMTAHFIKHLSVKFAPVNDTVNKTLTKQNQTKNKNSSNKKHCGFIIHS